MTYVFKSRFLLAFIFVTGIQMLGLNIHTAQSQPKTGNPDLLSLSLSECLEMALENNRSRRVSQTAVAIAEAQYRQALSSYWPKMNVNILAHRMDENPNYIFPEENSSYTIQGLAPVPMNVQVHVPEKDVKLMDRDSIFGSFELIYPLYTGGRRSAISKQAKIGVQVAKASARRTDLQVIFDVKRMYYGAILAKKLQTIGQQTLDRFQVTLDLTERLYQTGSGTVKKTDYLRTKVIVSTLQSMLEAISSNEALARAALTTTMGLDWRMNLVPAEKEIPFQPIQGDLEKLISNAYQFNPDWEKLELALKAAEAGVKKARSGHFPVVALLGNLSHIENSYDKGRVTEENVNAWSLGLNLSLPIFDGFRTVNAVKEAKMRFEKRQHESVLFREGLALMIKDALMQIGRSQGQVLAIRAAMGAALENRELNIRAYQNELAETKDVIEAQLMESFINGNYLKALSDHATFRAKLDFLIGKRLQSIFG